MCSDKNRQKRWKSKEIAMKKLKTAINGFDNSQLLTKLWNCLLQTIITLSFFPPQKPSHFSINKIKAWLPHYFPAINLTYKNVDAKICLWISHSCCIPFLSLLQSCSLGVTFRSLGTGKLTWGTFWIPGLVQCHKTNEAVLDFSFMHWGKQASCQ